MAKNKLPEPDGNRSPVVQTLSLALNHWAHPFWFTNSESTVWDIRQETPVCSTCDNQDISLSRNYGRIRGKLTGISQQPRKLTVLQCTNRMHLCASWEAASCSAIQQIPCFLWNQKVNYPFHKSPQPDESSPYINSTSLRSILIFFSLRLCLPSRLFPSIFLPKPCMHFYSTHGSNVQIMNYTYKGEWN
jgi:hypothetical protein